MRTACVKTVGDVRGGVRGCQTRETFDSCPDPYRIAHCSDRLVPYEQQGRRRAVRGHRRQHLVQSIQEECREGGGAQCAAEEAARIGRRRAREEDDPRRHHGRHKCLHVEGVLDPSQQGNARKEADASKQGVYRLGCIWKGFWEKAFDDRRWRWRRRRLFVVFAHHRTGHWVCKLLLFEESVEHLLLAEAAKEHGRAR